MISMHIGSGISIISLLLVIIKLIKRKGLREYAERMLF